jgi:alkylation response protein AidB-like acyl-CoA dehydrogenase
MYNGTPVYLLSSFAFLKRPSSWLQAIAKYRATHSEGPSFAYRYCVRRVTAEQKKNLDLSSWRCAGIGAEPIHPGTRDEFYHAFASCGLRREAFRPCYGLAEATLLVTATPPAIAATVGHFDAEALRRGEAIAVSSGGSGVQALSGCGRPVPGFTVAIVDPDTCTHLGEDRAGEVWLSGPSVANGYWDRERESEDQFRARIAGDDRAWLRTGDIGFLRDGELFITSRIKELIIIRGINHFPPDIEWTVQQAHRALRSENGAAFSIDEDGEEKLCVVQELERADYSAGVLDEIHDAIARAVTDTHGIPLHALALIRRGSLLKTSSGKVQRRAMRAAFLEGRLKADAIWRGGLRQDQQDQTRPGGNLRGTAADDLLRWLRDYAQRRINSRLIDERRCVPPVIIMDFGNRGLFGLTLPQQYGGLGLSRTEAWRIYEQLGAIDLSLATLVFLHNTNGVLSILRFGRPELRDELLPLLASGRELAALGLSEPEAGSNLAAMQTRVMAEADDWWRVDGVKRWNGFGWAGVMTVFGRHTDAAGRLRAMSALVVRQNDEGVELGPESLTMGMRGIMQNSVRFNRTRVAGSRLLGAPGDGLKIAAEVLLEGRLAAAATGLGTLQRCAQLILRYASRRSIDTGLLLENPQTAVRVSALLHTIASVRGLLGRCAATLDSGQPLPTEVAMAAKVFVTDSVNVATDLAMQLLGGRGYMETNLIPQLLRDGRALSIGEGANEGLTAAIGRGTRLGGSVQQYLRKESGEKWADALDELAAAGGVHGSMIWRDALLGRAAIAAIVGQAAEGESEPCRDWAVKRFEEQCREAARAASGAPGLLSTSEIVSVVDGFSEIIGDHEPEAPDVDWELDPLLRRTHAGTDRVQRRAAGAADARLSDRGNGQHDQNTSSGMDTRLAYTGVEPESGSA